MPDLFSPLRIGAVEVRNRLMQAAHSKIYSQDGHDTEQEIAYVERRARGGVGLMVSGNRFVHPSAAIRGFQDGWRDDTVPWGRRLTEVAQRHGARIFVQLNHHGAQAQPQGPDGPRAVYSASRVLSPATGFATKEATHGDIDAFVAGWAQSARVARKSGFDGVEVHMAHGYLLQQFLSPLYNHRTDEYGGDLEGRTRFPRRVLRAVRDAVGDDYVVGIRIVADEFFPGGLTSADVLDVIDLLRAEARLDFIDLGAGGYHNPHYVFPSAAMPAAWMRDEVAAVKARNPDVAVFGVGAARDVETAADVIRTGIADMVALTRAQIADPDLAEKLRTGRTDDVVHCIRLNQGCLGRGASGLPMSCTVNPVVGRERHREDAPPAPGRQRWVVVGGGPGGMKAAASLAANGHEVVLLERDDELGGQLRLVRTVPGRETVQLLLDDLERAMIRHGADVRLGTPATAALIGSLEPEGVVLATGARAPAVGTASLAGTPPLTVPDGAGDLPVVDAFAALHEPAQVGRRVALVDDDGSSYAAGVALVLLERGHDVHLLSFFDAPFPQVQSTMDRPLLLQRLAARHLRVTRNARVEHLGDRLAVTDGWSGRRQEDAVADTVVLSTPREAVDLDTGHLDVPTIVPVGDAVTPRGIDAAVFDAYEVAFAAGRVTPRGVAQRSAERRGSPTGGS